MNISSKKSKYQRLFLQIESLMSRSEDSIAQMATVSSVLYNKIDYFFWCGFYRLIDGKLIVGPYQGPLACQELEKDKGVCWAGIIGRKSIIVPDVHKFPGHIGCDSRSKSEIVIPVMNKVGQAIAVLDVDSKVLNSFDEIDEEYLTKIVMLISSSS